MRKNYFKNKETGHYFEVDNNGIFVITEDKYLVAEKLDETDILDNQELALKSKNTFMKSELTDLFEVKSNSVESYYLDKVLFVDLFPTQELKEEQVTLDGITVIIDQKEPRKYKLSFLDLNNTVLKTFYIDDKEKRLQDFMDSM